MKVEDLVSALQAEMKCGAGQSGNPVTGAYCSDLLSDVMAHAQKDDLWITIQTHQNIVAVASLLELAGIIITGGGSPDPETITKAVKENIPVLTSELSSFEVAGRLYCLLGKDAG
ncbi:MAG TPA: DRTGG domain-containing protein [Bacillota bacterium]|nr:DRTGG domain-containing protein [Bacillota bacterium]